MLTPEQPKIGNLVRELRQEMRLTQEKFAARLGVTFPTINRWENGRATPSPLALAKIDDALHQLDDRGQSLLTKHFPEVQQGV
jgi:putative transcriptional regulator